MLKLICVVKFVKMKDVCEAQSRQYLLVRVGGLDCYIEINACL